ncbi:HNH endonuclease [Blautia obeum]|uniref:HNH endonuclease n=2 Tax=Blautia obeum TaxID=40520 RepID=A0A414VZ09_9FIRM|nr:HNH endonuclease [Blautia obeum]RHH16757.1 HNH endonuclease [Blautia obeum]
MILRFEIEVRLFMANRENCVYCGKPITKRSREHIIQNAIGGLYESEDICCPDCNNYISKYIDVPFTKIFNAIISRIENFTKTNNKKSKPVYTGKAAYGGKVYDVSMKAGKVISCPELSKELKCDISKLNFEILAYDFPIDNIPFTKGLSKIAFNFALDKGISLDILKEGLKTKVTENGIEDISFKYPVIPFVPLNPMDKHIELNTSMELYHNLILFSQGEMLWCYIDLFNTFQYYVLLSDKWDKSISVHETYLQLLQKLNRSVPELYIRKPKHILTYAMFYNVEPSTDLEIFKKRVAEAIKKESLKKSMADVISAKMVDKYLTPELLTQTDTEERDFYLKSLLLYSNEDDSLNEKHFRTVTLTGNDLEITSYPLLINLLVLNGELDVRRYTYEKFNRLNKFLTGFDKIENVMDE